MGETQLAFDSPPFADHNVVYAKYCDGGSWTGNSSEVYENLDPKQGPVVRIIRWVVFFYYYYPVTVSTVVIQQ